MHSIIDIARTFALQEIELHGSPNIGHFDLSNKKGQELARRHGADAEIVLLGTILMDCKLGACIKEGKIAEHVGRSVDAARTLLETCNYDPVKMEKVLNCVAAHHKHVPFTCIEAEVCANADCYRFLAPEGVMRYVHSLGKRNLTFDEFLEQVEFKADEKWHILSLPACKQELEQQYRLLKGWIAQARIR